MEQNRFQDQNLRVTDFQQEVCVVCPQCAKKAIARVNQEEKKARLFCEYCGYNKDKNTEITQFGITGNWLQAASNYFDVALWYLSPFKNDFFFAYNEQHLLYLEQYISAKLREHKDRTHFTILEKLPKFYHEAKNREALLKIIERLKKK